MREETEGTMHEAPLTETLGTCLTRIVSINNVVRISYLLKKMEVI